MSSLDYLDLCRLCLVKERVSVPIFEGEGDVRQIFLKIAACLPVKVNREDKLPKKICDDCVYKVELFYQFWNTTVNSEKQLLQWLGESGLEENKQQSYSNVLDPNVMKQEQSGGNRLDGNMIQQVSSHQNDMSMSMIDNIGLTMPIMMPTSQQQQITSVPMDTSGSSVQAVQEMPSTSTQAVHEQIAQSQPNAVTQQQQEEEEESSDEDENSDDECDADEGLPVKEENEEDPNNSRAIEPTTFVNVSLACDEAGPSGLQQQKIPEMPEMTIPQSTDGDSKSGKGDFGTGISLMSERIGQSIEEKDSLEFYSDEQVNICKKEEVQEENQLYHICSKCHMRFPLESMLKRHKAVHHLRVFVLKTKRTKQKYERRSKSTVRKSTKKIRKEVQKQEYSCTQCNFNSRSQAALRVHLKRKHKKKLKITNELDFRRSKRLESAARSNFTEQSCLVCDSCDFQCETVDVLTAHTSQCRGKIDLKVENCSSKLEKSNRRSLELSNSRNESFKVEETTGTTLFCSCCTFRCKKRSTMSSHVARKHNDKERNSGNSEECCDLCDFKCSKKSTLYSHKRRHKAETLAEVYSCNECDFKTVKKTSLYSHIKRKHKVPNSCTGDEQPELFYCNQCDYKNKNKYELKVHVARKHTDDFKFSCETCGKKFKVKGDLTNHIRFSHREQPVICDVCGKTCLNSNSLYVHQKFAHYKAKYECQVCKRRMVSQENLNEHMIRQHERKENVVCEECGKTFSRNSRLKVHMRIHTGDKPYTCTICSKAFARRTALKQHLLIHTGIRPYVCDICGKAFTQKPGLISHRKSHPGSHPPLPRVLIDHILNDVMNN